MFRFPFTPFWKSIRRYRKRDAAEEGFSSDLISIGFVYNEEISIKGDKEDIKNDIRDRHPSFSEHKLGNAAGHFLRFRDEISVGDSIIAYEGENVVSGVGIVQGTCVYNDKNSLGDPKGLFGYPNQRSVKWEDSPCYFSRWKLMPDLSYWVGLPGTVYIKKGFRINRLKDLFS